MVPGLFRMRSLKASVAKDNAADSFQLDDWVCSSVEKQPFVERISDEFRL